MQKEVRGAFRVHYGTKTSVSNVYGTLVRNGMRHFYIKPQSPQLNGKVERSHLTDKEEFYQLLTYTDDVDLNEKLAEWNGSITLIVHTGLLREKCPMKH